MEIDFTTLALELINFLILVWLLKRFLYQPILNVVEKRQNNIKNKLDAANEARDQADKIQQDYQSRLERIDQDRQRALHRLDEELLEKRTTTLEAIRQAANREEEKALRARENKDQQWRREVEQQALLLATRFAATVFNKVADSNLHHRLVQLAIEQIKNLDKEYRQRLKHQLETIQDATVFTALPLVEDEKKQIEGCLKQQLQVAGKINFQKKSELIAGIRLGVGAWSLGLNLADELKGFANCIHEPLHDR